MDLFFQKKLVYPCVLNNTCSVCVLRILYAREPNNSCDQIKFKESMWNFESNGLQEFAFKEVINSRKIFFMNFKKTFVCKWVFKAVSKTSASGFAYSTPPVLSQYCPQDLRRVSSPLIPSSLTRVRVRCWWQLWAKSIVSSNFFPWSLPTAITRLFNG